MSSPMEARPRLSLPLSEKGHALADWAFQQCWSADRAVMSFLRAHPPSFGPEGLHVLGFGVGNGEFDFQLLYTLHTLSGEGPRTYVAIDTNKKLLEVFEARLDAEPPWKTRFTFLALRAEDYVPQRRFDLIHYIQSLYYMHGSEERLIRSALEHLTPEGRLLITLSSERGGIYQLMQRFWHEIDYSAFTGGLFSQERLRALLERDAIPYHSELYPQDSIDVSACFEPDSRLGRHLLNFLLQADLQRAPKSLRQRVLETLADLSPLVGGRRLLPHPNGVFMVTAPTGG